MRHTALSLHRTATFPPALADVRGHELRTRDRHRKVGKIDDLVCGPDGQVRYLDVQLGGLFQLFHRKRVLLPIGVARVDRQNDVAWVARLTKEQVKALPAYAGDPDAITEDYEARCRAPHRSHEGTTGARTDADLYLYDQGQFYSERGGPAARAGRVVLAGAAGTNDDVVRAS